ncbi:hypothetical protein [Bradyrhizobium sp. URHC0002]
MNLISALNQAMQVMAAQGGRLKVAADELSELIGEHPELHPQLAAAFVVLMLEPGLSAHRAAWEQDQDTDMFDAINRLCRP